MDFPERRKPTNCDEYCDCKDCEALNANDDEKILVSVNPRRFGLPPGQEKHAKMEIENQNSYPIYFKAGTSNMEAFRAEPNNGCIRPNGKVSVNVQFYDSAMPLRRHEEVIVFTSVKPFEKYTLYEERVCPYCMEPFDFSKHHSVKSHHHTQEFEQEHRNKKSCTPLKMTPMYYAESNHNGGCEKYKIPHHNNKIEYDMKHAEPKSKLHREQKHTENIDDGKEKEKHQTTYYAQMQFLEPQKKIYSDEKLHNITENTSDRTKHMTNCYELKEVCIHALVHRPSSGGCECGNCIKLGIHKENEKELERHLESEEQRHRSKTKSDEDIYEHRRYRTERDTRPERHTTDVKDDRKSKEKDAHVERYLTSEERKERRNTKSDENIQEPKLYRSESDTYTGHGTKGLKYDRKGKGKEAHIRTRILRAKGGKEAVSDTEISELSSRDLQVVDRKTKIISEEDYNKKKEKLKKKHQKHREEESESTTTTEFKETFDKMAMMLKKSEKETKLNLIYENTKATLRLSWANLILILLIISVAVGGLIYCCRSDKTSEQPQAAKCILNYLQDFQ